MTGILFDLDGTLLNSLEDLPEMPGLETDGQLRLSEDGAVLDELGGE